jgi:Carboxypeptidase regulatory-like domain
MEVFSMSESVLLRTAAKTGAALLVLATLSLALAACGTSASTASGTSKSSVVTGSVTGYGGPIRIVKGKVVDMKPWSIADMAVILTRPDSRTTYRVYTDGSGRFSIRVPRGEYQIAAGCEPGRTQSVTLHGGPSESVQLACDYP